jgi:hypothetical protein
MQEEDLVLGRMNIYIHVMWGNFKRQVHERRAALQKKKSDETLNENLQDILLEEKRFRIHRATFIDFQLVLCYCFSVLSCYQIKRLVEI